MSASSSPTSMPLLRQRHRQVDRHGGLADAALAGGHRDDRLHLRQQQRRLLPAGRPCRAAMLPAALPRLPARAWPCRRRRGAAPPPAALCAVSTAVALVTPGWRASSASTSRRTGSIAAACARSVSSDTCTRPPRSSMPSTRPALTMSCPRRRVLDRAQCLAQSVLCGGHGAILLLRPGESRPRCVANTPR